MNACKISVIIPTRNRPARLRKTLEGLSRQDLARECYEIIVVDDGSTLPLSLNTNDQLQACTLIRLEGVERSAARNRGATVAVGETLLFLDDDMAVSPNFLSVHLRAHEEWRGALIVGGVRLPEETQATPFGRFRQRLEQRDTPRLPGPSAGSNFCTAANMSIGRDVFDELGGFDIGLCSSEDQDLALRHIARGAEMVFLPAAEAIHWDQSLDIRSYCGRAEWGSRLMIPFCERYRDLPDNVERNRVNGPVRLSREPVSQSARKLIKRTIAAAPVVALLFAIASLLERIAPNGRALNRVYRLLLGAHILRGYRNGRRSSTGEKKTEASPQRNTFGRMVVDCDCCACDDLITLPTRDTVYRMDDWDYIGELNSLSFSDYVFKVNADGQFDPLSKLVYGAFLRAFNYSNLPLALFNFVIGWSSVLSGLRSSGSSVGRSRELWPFWRSESALSALLMCSGFRFRVRLKSHCCCFLCRSIFCLTAPLSCQSACGAALLGGSLAFGNGVVAPFTLAAAFLLTRLPALRRTAGNSWSKDRRVVAMLLLSVAVVVICDAVPRIVQGRGIAYSLDLAGIATYFFWAELLMVRLVGLLHCSYPDQWTLCSSYFSLLYCLGSKIERVTRAQDRSACIIPDADCDQLADRRDSLGKRRRSRIQLSVCVHGNVFLQLPLVAILVGIVNERLDRRDVAYQFRVFNDWVLPAVAVLPLVLGLSCSLKARSLVFSLERGRAQCLSAIVAGDSSKQCISRSTIDRIPNTSAGSGTWSINDEASYAALSSR